VVSTGGRLYLRLAGATFLAPPGAMTALEEGYALGRSASASGSGVPALATMGIEPGAWLVHPSLLGPAKIAGADTIHIVAALNVARFLADARRLSSAGEALTGGPAGSPLALLGSVRSARADLYTGARDHLLRRLALTAELSGGTAAPAARTAPLEATLAFELQFTQLNVPQTIAPPAGAQPPSALGPALQRLGLGRGPAPRA
jgi:hypothetical protein